MPAMCILLGMDFARIQQLRHELLQNRRLAITAGFVVIAFWIVTIVGGYFLVRHAFDDDHVSVRSLNTPTQIGLLLDDSMPDLIYHIVYFNDVKIESGPTDDVYFATGPKGTSVLVVATGRKTPNDTDAVDIRGTVRPIPPLSTLTRKWKLSKDQVKAVRKQGIYIEADDIKSDRVSVQRLAAKK